MIRLPSLPAIAIAAIVVALPAYAAEKLASHPVGFGTSISVPKTWEFNEYPMPMGATNFRIVRDDLRMAVTGMPFPTVRNEGEAPPPLGGRVQESMAPYLGSAKESAVVPVEFNSGEVRGAYGTLHAADGQGFPVFMGRSYACVTTAVVEVKAGVFAISVGSNDCDGDLHKAAISAIASMHSE